MYGAVRLLGVGGYRGGRPLTVALILLVGGGLAFFFTRTIDDSSDRAIWLTAASLLAVTLGIHAASVAPPSKGRIVEQLDGMKLPFFQERSTTTSGHSWCRPDCPVVRRVYSAPPTNVAGALQTVFYGLSQAHLVAKQPLSRAALVSGTARAHGRTVTVDVRVIRGVTTARSIPRVKVVVRVSAHRP